MFTTFKIIIDFVMISNIMNPLLANKRCFRRTEMWRTASNRALITFSFLISTRSGTETIDWDRYSPKECNFFASLYSSTRIIFTMLNSAKSVHQIIQAPRHFRMVLHKLEGKKENDSSVNARFTADKIELATAITSEMSKLWWTRLIRNALRGKYYTIVWQHWQ